MSTWRRFPVLLAAFPIAVGPPQAAASTYVLTADELKAAMEERAVYGLPADEEATRTL
jgi:hypothetical protein